MECQRIKHMEKTMNKENAWDQKTEIGIVKDSVKEVSLGKNNNCNEENKIRKSIWTFKDEHGNNKCK